MFSSTSEHDHWMGLALQEAEAAAAEGEVPASMLAPTLTFATLLLILGIGNAIVVARVLEPMLPGGSPG